MLPFELKELVLGVISGEARAISRALSLIERNSDPSGEKLLQRIYPYGGNTRIVGITGAVGVGKSSLIFQLARALRKRGHTVGVISIDPTSPISHGAFLGDRVRMQDLTADQGVFIRSVAGGADSVESLTRKIFGLVHVMEASGKHFVLVETMGSGQSDCLIAKVAQSTLYVSIPSLGDEIQAMKAGILEMSDIVVINKADHEGTDRAITWWKNIFSLETRKSGAWKTPILAVNSLTGEGAGPILTAIDDHERHMKDSGEWERRKKEAIRTEVKMLILERLRSEIETRVNENDIGGLLERKTDPLAYIDKALRKKRKTYA
ncbi:MAG: methylmalonyl Co-A mutase-associated GTPase MeaB [Elusimicrobia bacterium]|nr:methylmalonyl Co-A mutase-associated GTPase MeaB [Elusimicrobiota bacterium]